MSPAAAPLRVATVDIVTHSSPASGRLVYRCPRGSLLEAIEAGLLSAGFAGDEVVSCTVEAVAGGVTVFLRRKEGGTA